jgi:hypothetical protein
MTDPGGRMNASFQALFPLISIFAIACGSSDAHQAGSSSSPSSTASSAAAETYETTTSFVDVPPGGEIYKCQDFGNPFAKDIAILESESDIMPGSHHFAAFRIEGLTTAPMMDCPNGGLEAHEFVHAAQTLVQKTTYPKDVGRFLPATDGLRLMVHYLNTTVDPLHVQARFSMKYVDAAEIKYKAGGVFLNNLGLMVPPGASTVSKSYTLDTDIKLLGAVSHMHRHAVGFTSSTDDGRKIYEGAEWDEPKVAAFDPPMELSAGTTIDWACSYQNDTGDTLGFGESAAKNEMCILNGVFYPTPDGSSLTQNIP